MRFRPSPAAFASLAAAFLTIAQSVDAQRPAPPRSAPVAFDADSARLAELPWRSIGPAVTSGRVVDFAVPEGPRDRIGDRMGDLFYVASASGGVWKTVNAGTTYEPIFDKQGAASIGDIAVAPTNPDILWVGTGEANNQRSSSWGDGVYKSENGGRTWTHMGLRRSEHIGRIIIHPANPQVVFVASPGPLWGPGGDRGLFKTVNGGRTWRNVKNIDQHTGFTDVIFDPRDPNVIYAASYQRERRPYTFVGGGPGSGIWKSTDGGESWTRLSEGLPKVDVGRIGLDVSRSSPNVVYATIETKVTTAAAATGLTEGSIYRSDDYGASWQRMGAGSSFAWYMGQIRVDPSNADRIYFLGVPLQTSSDGGRTFRTIATESHVDHHGMWINPNNPDHFILGNDGGVYITHDRGRTVDFSPNLPIAQYYAIGADLREPYYYVYGGLQDNNSWAGPSQTRNVNGITNSDWFATTGGDGFYAVIDPTDPNVVYGESQGGDIVRYDVRTGERKTIKPQPKFGGKRYRWNWSAPIVISNYDHKTLYFGANHLFKSTTRGDSWVTLGPDLTRQRNRDSLLVMGKKWPRDAVARHSGTAEYGNISTIDESAMRRGLIYVGTDDGVISVTRDDGATWQRMQRFPGVPDETYISRVVASRAAEGTVYATLDNHRNNDFKPYVLKSTNYGSSWTSIASNLPAGGSVQVIREHPRNPNLLFVGTEFGAFYSANGGRSWTQLKYNLPTVAVHDIVIHPRENDLIIGTHGRGIYIIDDITPLERLAEASASAAYLFPVKAATQYNPNASIPGGLRGAGALGDKQYAAPNPAFGTAITYFLRDSLPRGGDVTLAIHDAAGNRVRELTANKKPGMHRVTWDLRTAPPYTPTRPAGQALVGQGGGRGAELTGPFVLPGRYTARLTMKGAGGASSVKEVPVEVRADPLVQLSAAEYRALYDMRAGVVRMQATVQAAVRTAEQLRDQAVDAKGAIRSGSGPDTLTKQTEAIEKEVNDVLRKIRGAPATEASADDRQLEEPSIQERVNSVASQIGNVTSPATQLQRETLELAMADLRRETGRLNALLAGRVPALNSGLDAEGIPWTIGRPINITR
ncbi:MAG: glycosyl hydrolase [Gemmatimonadaceae bacterium]|nr:glycosyl hydrolase [Gemmatimonadaceae bacterium]